MDLKATFQFVRVHKNIQTFISSLSTALAPQKSTYDFCVYSMLDIADQKKELAVFQLHKVPRLHLLFMTPFLPRWHVQHLTSKLSSLKRADINHFCQGTGKCLSKGPSFFEPSRCKAQKLFIHSTQQSFYV